MNKKCLMFDLDGVLAESKQDIPDEIANLLLKCTVDYKVVIISGCSWRQMKNQCLGKLHGTYEMLHEIFLLPTSGSQIRDAFGNIIFEDMLKLKDKGLILNVFEDSFNSNIDFDDMFDATGIVFGDIEEDRGSQITFSLKGQEAPLYIKEEFQRDFDSLRHQLAREMQLSFDSIDPGRFQVRVGGTTSIDVTYADRDKGFGAQKILLHLGLLKEDTLFFGDMLQEGGNDYPIKELGINCIEVKNWQDTHKWLKDILCLNAGE